MFSIVSHSPSGQHILSAQFALPSIVDRHYKKGVVLARSLLSSLRVCMDILPRITGQLIDRIQEMSFLQRTISLAFVVVVGIGLSGLVIFKNQSEFQPVSFGKVFGSDELVSVEKILANSGLTGYRRDGQRLLAPKKDLDRYNAALLEFDALPADLGTQMLKQYETLGPFSTDRQRQQMKEALLLQELRRMIKAVPDIEDARVAVASSERRTGWNPKPRANVAITPRAGREISATLIHSLRHVVSSMVPDLAPSDVTIFDVTRGQAFTGETPAESMESQYMSQARQYARQSEQQILKALSYIPNVGVAVQVDFDEFRSSMARRESIRSRGEISPVANRPAVIDDPENHLTGFRGTNESTREFDAQTLLSVLPKAMRVSISIPRDYLRDIATRSSSNGDNSGDRPDMLAIEDEVLFKVERTVARLISEDSGKNSITITCVDRLDGVSTDRSKSVVKSNGVRSEYVWSGGLALCALVFLVWFLRPSPMRATESGRFAVKHGSEAGQFEAPISAETDRLHSPDRATTLRDDVRGLVQSDPAAAADLLCRWLSEANQ